MWDICVVGTGLVGMAFAMECERLGLEVLVLESGGAEVNSATEDASRAEIVNPRHHVAMEIAVCRALGGTSWKWGGRCVAFNEADWLPRDFVADSRWPIDPNEVTTWYQAAARYFLCGEGVFSVPYKRSLTNGLTFDFVERWAATRLATLTHRDHLISSQGINLSLNSTVTDLNLSADGQRVESLAVHSPGGKCIVRARRIVLAMGGVETTRLLLVAQRRWPRNFGGVDGPLGRYYMGHLTGKLAKVHFSKAVSFSDIDLALGPGGSYYRRRLMLTTEMQLKHKLLNTAFWAENPNLYDPSHRSFALSAIYLVLAFKATGKLLVSEGIRRAQIGMKPSDDPETSGSGKYPLWAHFRNLIFVTPSRASDLYKVLRDRFLIKRKKPIFMVPNSKGCYPVQYHAEMVPTPESRIQIGSQTDSFGVPRAVIDLRYSEQDLKSVVDSHALLDEALQANGMGRLEYVCPPEQLREQVLAEAYDGYHQIGTTRMGIDPAESVVDPDLKVHGVENLYVASSSVFPTSAHANPTFVAVALGLRLANYLNARRSS